MQEVPEEKVMCKDGKYHIYDHDGKRLADVCRCGRKRIKKMV